MNKNTWGEAPDYPVAVEDASGNVVSFACVTITSPSNKEALANTIIAAAAPELLGALKDILRIAKAASIGVSGNATRIERAQSVIAKAEGK